MYVVGLEVGNDLIVVDVAQMPKVEKKVNAKRGDKKESRKWIEQNLQVDDKAPHRIKLLWVSERQPEIAKLQEMFNKVPSLKRAIEGELANFYDVYDDRIDNPEEKYPILLDLPLVRAEQLACLRLLNTKQSWIRH